ncbi:IclR family transcriptional regulator [Alsobacter soli]|uniref:IclR family transcriptional regulator n=1 Tax=Alsobacter soli TaxID=2109933 RepID=UPI0018AD341D|nr:IclR family transcriptional regulator [Alsobacter soli]
MVDLSSPVLTPRKRGRPASATAAEGGEIQSLDRAIGIMELLASVDGLSLSDIARNAELPTSTAHRMLATLQRRGLVAQDAETGHWTIGLGLFRIGSAYLRIRKLPDIGRPVIRELLRQVNETVNLSMLDGEELVCVAQAESHAPVRAFFRLGRRLPMHASAAGKAILAAMDERERARRLDGMRLEGFTANTHTDRKALEADIAAVRERGYGIDNSEHTVGMRCVSAAIFDENREPIGAVSISAPAVRMPDDAIAGLGAKAAETAGVLTALYSGRGGHAVLERLQK